ncbi:MAG: low specificity L-threonine aldolase [Crocinitomicaceae bacterium]|nr:low specificity L-threonine aldolase [Crocinitomicaceae bacterium]
MNTAIEKNRGFASDNYAGAHSEIIEAIQNVNHAHDGAYGNDQNTQSAKELFKHHFGANTEAYFVYNGTAANVLGLQSITNSFDSIICAETAHINVDECGAPERFTGCKLITVHSPNGKITIDTIKPHIYGFGDPHHSQPRVISITQPTELGTLYTEDEIKTLSNYAHENNMYLHLDGARLSNAAASFNKNFKEITFDLGVDVLSFGGTKNGLMFGEAIVFRDKSLTTNFDYIRKQGMQLASKMRFISAQFEALLSNDLWIKNARHANKMARILSEEVSKMEEVKITQNVEANGVFAIIPEHSILDLQDKYSFYVWDEQSLEVRWMCSFDTTEEDVRNFVSLLKKSLKDN